MDTGAVLTDLAHVLQPAGYAFALAGGHALIAYGMGRTTNDLDLIVPAAAQQLVVSTLEARGYETLSCSPGFSNHLHRDPRLGRVDFIYVDPQTADKLFAEGRRQRVAGLGEIVVPSAVHLIAMKVHAIKSNPARRLRDLADIQFLLRSGEVNVERARHYFEAAGMNGDWDEVAKTL